MDMEIANMTFSKVIRITFMKHEGLTDGDLKEIKECVEQYRKI